ncbi:MAG: DUF2973 domain-containing protein [Okeania sp. SIO2C2]|uniref:DUF2973 domain-containing protein n=1 Tax=unclassified Okeania TaxID=2634635 RepID=UPI0013B78CA2|nr:MULTISPECIES: DUF2973 domain-containing protein [unclassified Okeania]NEP05550.1 DUF2973 domain-containing protein [Okeania sp. SIO4D6]NEP45346.1 DUF2973 domain-containing protein [Okeania sp. SIO2H7]NEP72522.1 DUF2973 domain-containing protein [Okeania sp. SIO2G5]NEP88494.1 DUF2973 domain-containing protein [Okeania sp. SIO2C2]NEP93342.1 DUF2973 domain-containing protein [Okeania sp. SIO2F5]
MLHLLYILAFTTVAVLAVRNLIRSLLTVGLESQSLPSNREWSSGDSYSKSRRIPHPELLDESGNFIDEPLLVMRSVNVQEARQQLDAIYNSELESSSETRDEKDK